MNYRKKTGLVVNVKYEDLPPWMHRNRREIDWAFLVICIFCAVIVWPLFARSGLPFNAGTQAAVSRTTEIAHSIQSGVLYPRWAPDYNYGYGSPIWNYVAPLPHYLSGLHQVLVQCSPETSVKVVIALSMCVVALGLFSFVRRRMGVYAGLLAVAAFLFSPQISLVKPYIESDMPGLLAVGAFVCVLWAFDRVQVERRGWDIGAAALALAVLLVTDTPLNIVLLVIVAGWLGWRALCCRTLHCHWGRTVLAAVLGIGLGAFYWVPAWFERGYVRWLPVPTQSSVVERLFSLHDLFGPVQRLDLSAANSEALPALGIVAWLGVFGAIVGPAAWIVQRRSSAGTSNENTSTRSHHGVSLLRAVPVQQREMMYFFLVGIGLLFLVTPGALPFWERIPSWPRLHSGDLLPVMAVCAAMGVAQLGHAVETLLRPVIAAMVTIGVVGAILAASLTTLYPPPWSNSAARVTDVTAVLREEVRGHAVASQTTGWLLPEAVTSIPNPSIKLLESYENDQVDKVARDMLPAAVRVDILEHKPQRERLIVETAQPATLTLMAFDFPGWHAEVGGKDVSVQTAEDTGFISIPVDAGRHQVYVNFGSTRIRDLAWIITFGSALAAVVVAIRMENRLALNRDESIHDTTTEKTGPLLPAQYITLATSALLLGLGGALPRLAPELFTVRSPRGIVLDADVSLPRALQGGMDLLAYDISFGDEVAAGENLLIRLYWRAVRPDLPDYQVNVTVFAVDEPGRNIAYVQRRHPGKLPTSQWPMWPLMDYYIRDEYLLSLADDAPPGRYGILVQVGRCSQYDLFACDTIDPLFVRDERGTSLGQYMILPTAIVITP